MHISTTTRRRLLTGLLALAALTFLAGAASAGTVYVALASDTNLDGLRMSTEVLIANPTNDPVEIAMHFIPKGVNGADRPEGFEAAVYTIPARETTTFENLNQGHDRGIVEITIPPLVSVSARQLSFRGGKVVGWTEIPVIGSEELTAANQFQVINGLSRSDSMRTALGIVNLSQSANSCNVQVVGPGGGAFIPVTAIPVPPLSGVYFADAVLAAGRNDVDDARVQVICDGPSYSYAVGRDIATGSLYTLRPGVEGSSSSLRAPGAQEPCPPNAFCWEVPGQFFVPTPSKAKITFDIPAPQDSFGAVAVRVTAKHNGWDSRDSTGLHGFFWLYRNNTWRSNTYGYVNARGPGKNLLINTLNANLPAKVTNRSTANVALQPGQTYTVDYLYDTRTGTVRTTFSLLDGTVIADFFDVTTTNRVHIEEGFKVQVGLEREHVEVPTYGWVYSDLSVQFYK